MPPVGTENQPMQCGAMAKTSRAPSAAPAIGNENRRRAGGGPAGAPPALRSSRLNHILLRQLLLGVEIVRHIAGSRRSAAAVAKAAVVVAVDGIEDDADQEPLHESPPR